MKTAEHPLVLIYRIDARDLITSVNPAWTEFARDNFGEAVSAERVLGKNVLAAVTDETVRELYRQLIKRARQGWPVSFHYRCDSPDKCRTFEMNIRQVAGGEVEFASTLTQEEVRPTVAVLVPGGPRSEELIRVCSWCQKVAMPDQRWLPVEEAVEELHLFKAEHLPGLTHGICPPCHAGMLAKLAQG